MKKMTLLAMGLALAVSAGQVSAQTQPQEKKTETQQTVEKTEKKVEKKTIDMDKAWSNAKRDAKEGVKSTEQAADRALTRSSDKSAMHRGYQLGQKIDSFTLKQAQTGQMASLEELKGDKATVVVFWNQDCPWCEGENGAANAIEKMAESYKDKGVSVLLVDPGIDKSEDKIVAYSKNKQTPILINNDSSLAVKFDARYTPHTFVLDKDLNLVYKGAFHVKRGDQVRTYAQDAVEDVIAGQEVVVPEALGRGCTIKWSETAKPKV